MKALVTGANGFLGRRVVAALMRRGISVRALVRPATNVEAMGWKDEVEVHRADLRVSREDVLRSAFDGVGVLVHLAAAVTGGDDAQFAAAVAGTERLLGAMKGTETRKLVLASSFSVYDFGAVRGVLDEDSPTAKGARLYERDGYAIAKSWQERVARRLSAENGWDLAVIRPGAIWGPGQELPARSGLGAGRFFLVIGPTTRLPLTHVEGCAELFALAAEDPSAAASTINAVDGHDVTAWTHAGDHFRLSGDRKWRVPVPYLAGLAVVGMAGLTSRVLFGGKGKLPSILVKPRFVARFRPLKCSNARAMATGWRPLDRETCLDRTYGPGKEAAPSPPAGAPSRPAEPALPSR